MFEETKKAWDIITNPGKATATMSMGEALGFYYRASILPVIVAIIVGFVVGYLAGNLLGSVFGSLGALLSSGTGAAVGLLVAVLAALYLLVLVPVGMVIDAAIYQLFAKVIFKMWEGAFNKTFTAITYGMMPVLLFFWLALIPIVNLLLIVVGLWSIAVFVISLSTQHKVSAWRALGGVVLTWVVVVAIMLAIEVVAVVL